MFSEQLKQSKVVKEVIDFLNKETPGLFYAIIARAEGNNQWQIVCMDFDYYMDSPDFKMSKEAIRTKYPELEVIFCYMAPLYPITVEELKKKKVWIDKEVIMIK